MARKLAALMCFPLASLVASLHTLVDVQITIPGTRDQMEGGTHYFGIEVTQQGKHWLVRHRYSEFLSLKDKLGTKVDTSNFPGKISIFNLFTFDRRRVQLEAWLQKVLQHSMNLPHDALLEFLEETPSNEFPTTTEELAVQSVTSIGKDNGDHEVLHEKPPNELPTTTEEPAVECVTSTEADALPIGKESRDHEVLEERPPNEFTTTTAEHAVQCETPPETNAILIGKENRDREGKQKWIQRNWNIIGAKKGKCQTPAAYLENTCRQSGLLPGLICRMVNKYGSVFGNDCVKKSYLNRWFSITLLVRILLFVFVFSIMCLGCPRWLIAFSVLACGALLAIAFSRVLHYSKVWKTKVSEGFILEVVQEIVAVVFMIPCIFYFIRMLRQYSSDLGTHRKEIREAQEELLGTIEATLTEMEERLGNSTELSGGLATCNFKERRRDFRRFLDFCEQHSERKGGNEQLLLAMQEFCLKWFEAFSTFSLDPVKAPYTVVVDSDLARCRSVWEVATYCKDKLDNTPLPLFSKAEIEDRCLQLQKFCPVGRALRRQSIGVASSPWVARPAKINSRALFIPQVSWLIFGCSNYAVEEQIAEGGWPRLLRFGCGCLVILSLEHLLLLCTHFAVVVLFLSEVFRTEHDLTFLSPALVAGLCVTCILARFESVDVIQRLEREKRETEREKADVNKQREHITNYWTQIQEVSDFWLKRSIPFLELHHEIQLGEIHRAVFLDSQSGLVTLDRGDEFLAAMEEIRTEAYKQDTLSGFTSKMSQLQAFQQELRSLSAFVRADSPMRLGQDELIGNLGSFISQSDI